MSVINLDQGMKQIRFRLGLLPPGASTLSDTTIQQDAANNSMVSGEPAVTTNKHMWVHDGTINRPVQTLDLAVTYDDEVVCNSGEVVYSI